MLRLIKSIHAIGYGFNAIAGTALVSMMLLTCADVIMRMFGNPITGTYEIVGFLGTVIVAFAMAYTSMERSHVAVEVVFDLFPQRLQILIAILDDIIGAGLFGLICWQCFIYGSDLRQSGEVSMTIGMPVYPFAYGIALGSALLSLLLLAESARSMRRVLKS
ncbi:MAG: TRAP transporter small permease [Deltaproteobacteria bacterium]|nr:TRAP transporter small permease [Deltaproteobacteria bacterium]